MMKTKHLYLFFLLSIFLNYSFAQQAKNQGGFKVIPLGVKGGLDESNLSAYLVAANGTNNYICLDAGTINAGLQKAAKNKLFTERNAEIIQKKYIKGYFVSHAHLDHVAGLILNSPNDIAKNIYGIPSVIDIFKNYHFSWKAWANFANEGDKPQLNKYTYNYLIPGKAFDVAGTELNITPYLLSHVNPYESTAFLIKNKTGSILYLGDTGPDSIEGATKLKELWEAVATKVLSEELKAIFIEVSFNNAMPDKSLFGHLTPRLLMQELAVLDSLSDGKLKKVKIFITHIKPCENCEVIIKEEIKKENVLGLSIHYPEQGKLIEIHN